MDAISTPAQRANVLEKPDLSATLLAWFDHARRDMPWRKTRDAYAIWLSETMLQQTQVATVIPYYHKFLQRFPTVQALAAADLQEVLTLWAGLGYYRRARNLHLAAQRIVTDFGGELPRTAAGLMALPGVGRYTAGAVASMAFGERAAVVDGNVMRVLARVFALADDIAKPATQKKFWEIAESLVPPERPGDHNQAVMELGATVCVPVSPQCLICPIRGMCDGAQRGIQERLPVKSKRGPTPVVRRVAVVLVRAAAGAGPGAAWEGDGAGWEVLVVRRPGGVIWEHMWEFPALEVTEKQWSHLEKTGRADSPKKGVSGNNRGATTGRGGSTKAISRFNWLTHFADEVHERLGICVELDDWQAAVGHQLTHRTMDYRVLRGRVPESACEPRLPRCDAGGYAGFRWVRVGVPAGLPMSRAAGKIAAAAGIGEPAPFPPR